MEMSAFGMQRTLSQGLECKSTKLGLPWPSCPSCLSCYQSIHTNTILHSLIACAIYYWLWVSLIPKWKGYKLRQELINLDDGVQSNRLKKVPNTEIAEWDATHDVAGRLIEVPVDAEIQVLGKGTKTSSDGSRSYAHGANKGPNTTIQDSASVQSVDVGEQRLIESRDVAWCYILRKYDR